MFSSSESKFVELDLDYILNHVVSELRENRVSLMAMLFVQNIAFDCTRNLNEIDNFLL